MSRNVVSSYERGTSPRAAAAVAPEAEGGDEAGTSAVSWAAILGGALVAAALSRALIALGSGLGLLSVSPWSHVGVSAEAIAVGSVVWLCVMQFVSAGAGGYVAGRLRTRWTAVHSHEVYFRDTAHGLLVWCAGLLISAGVLTSAATGLLGGLGRAAGVVATGSAQALGTKMRDASTASPGNAASLDEAVDLLLRAEPVPSGAVRDPAPRDEFGRVLASSLRHGQVSAADTSYLAGQIAARTGLTQSAAERRVDEVFTAAKKTAADAETAARQATESARRTAASFSLWLFLSFLIGAFAASYAATIGGRQRDAVRARA